MHPKDAEGIANSVDPDQVVWSGSALFAQTCLSENLGKLRYLNNCPSGQLNGEKDRKIFQDQSPRRLCVAGK